MLWNHIEFLKLIIKWINDWFKRNVKKTGASNKDFKYARGWDVPGVRFCGRGMLTVKYGKASRRAFAFEQENWNPIHDGLISLIWSCWKNIIICMGWYVCGFGTPRKAAAAAEAQEGLGRGAINSGAATASPRRRAVRPAGSRARTGSIAHASDRSISITRIASDHHHHESTMGGGHDMHGHNGGVKGYVSNLVHGGGGGGHGHGYGGGHGGYGGHGHGYGGHGQGYGHAYPPPAAAGAYPPPHGGYPPAAAYPAHSAHYGTYGSTTCTFYIINLVFLNSVTFTVCLTFLRPVFLGFQKNFTK